jgi:hypothetical protein
MKVHERSGKIAGIKGAAALVALIAGATQIAPGTAIAAPATPGLVKDLKVSCSPDAFVTAIETAKGIGAARLLLSPNCVYNYTTATATGDALPIITGDITLVGGPSTTIRRNPTAPTAFRILEVASGATLHVRGISILDGSTAAIGGGILNAGTVFWTRPPLAVTAQETVARSVILRAPRRRSPSAGSTRTRRRAPEAAESATRGR